LSAVARRAKVESVPTIGDNDSGIDGGHGAKGVFVLPRH
jgi:hypothetical protein